jgi:hypothetical protein
MLQPFVDKFIASKAALIAEFRQEAPDSYDSLVTRLVTLLNDADEYRSPDPERITVIDHGHYQGTRLFIIGETGYQPSLYWAICVSYGSCSVCDTFEGIRGYSDKLPTETQAEDYYTLMLHMVQSMKEIGE